jgi:hypothetical protein
MSYVEQRRCSASLSVIEERHSPRDRNSLPLTKIMAKIHVSARTSESSTFFPATGLHLKLVRIGDYQIYRINGTIIPAGTRPRTSAHQREHQFIWP